MRRLLRNLLPTSRIGLALFAWRNRYKLLDWLGFGLRAVGGAASGKGTADARAEFRLRAALARDPMTRSLAIDTEVHDGVLTMTGKVSPEVHARIQDKAIAVPGITRINDRLVNVSPRRRGFRMRAA